MNEDAKITEAAVKALAALLNLGEDGARLIPRCLERSNAEYAIERYNARVIATTGGADRG